MRYSHFYDQGFYQGNHRYGLQFPDQCNERLSNWSWHSFLLKLVPFLLIQPLKTEFTIKNNVPIHSFNSWFWLWNKFSFVEYKHCTKMKFSMKDFFSKCEQIRRKQRIWSYLLKKSFMENFIFCAVEAVF